MIELSRCGPLQPSVPSDGKAHNPPTFKFHTDTPCLIPRTHGAGCQEKIESGILLAVFIVAKGFKEKGVMRFHDTLRLAWGILVQKR